MAHTGGRQPGTVRRSNGRPTRQLQASLDTEVHDLARDTARKAGVTISLYVQELIRRDQRDRDGRPVWWHELPSAHTNQEQLFDQAG